ncbi:MAG: oxidative damage protection protein [Gemmatimonadales bacterium]|nr:oxidative damage protection protein [Gemmatimonadales bacterium]
MPTIPCTRCRLERDRQAFPPFPNPRGQQLFRDVCAVCWAEWLKLQQQLINHYALNLRDPKAKEYLLQQMDQFLATSAPPA